MPVLYGNDAFSILVLSTKKTVPQVFGKRFCFPENLFQIQSIENIQNFHWLSHKNIPISQMESYLENL